MPIIAGAIMGGGALLGSALQSNAAKKAARQQSDTAQWLYQQQSAMNQPYMYAGNAALNTLAQLYGIDPNLQTTTGTGRYVGADIASPEQRQAALDMFYQSPEYTVQKNMLDQALMRQASATGTRYSPSTAIGQAEIAGRAFGDWRNNLSSLAQMGPNAASGQATSLQNLAQGMGGADATRFNAQSSMGATIGDVISSGGQAFGQFNAYRNQMDALKQLMQPQGFNYQPIELPGMGQAMRQQYGIRF